MARVEDTFGSLSDKKQLKIQTNILKKAWTRKEEDSMTYSGNLDLHNRACSMVCTALFKERFEMKCSS